MNKCVAFAICLLFIVWSAQAQQLAPSQVRLNAQRFANQISNRQSTAIHPVALPSIEKAVAFNMEGGGFVIASSDSRTRPVLAYSTEGYEWIDADNNKQSVLTYIRHGKHKKDDLVILLNMDINAHENFRMGVPKSGIYEEIFNSDDPAFGGSGVANVGRIESEDVPWNGREDSIVVRVPPLAGLVFKRTAALPKKPAAKKSTAKATA